MPNQTILVGDQRTDRLTSTVRSPEPTLLRVASTVLRHRISIIRFFTVGGIVGAAIALVMPRTFTADFSFSPQETTAKEGLTALASDLGVNVGGTASQSPAFYVDLLKTRKILSSLVVQPLSYSSRKSWLAKTPTVWSSVQKQLISFGK